jgi:hypothetical protein
MRFVIKLSQPVEFSRFQEVAATPLCHADKIFERSAGDQWLETRENLYQLLLSSEGFVTGAVTRHEPCSEFHDLIDFLGLTASIEIAYEEGETPAPDWDSISERYHLAPIAQKETVRSTTDLTGLRPVEDEVLRAIQLLAGPFGEIEVELFAHGFASNLSATLHSLARKRWIEFSPDEKSVRLSQRP